MVKQKVTREQQIKNVAAAQKRIEYDLKNRGLKKVTVKNKIIRL